MRSRNHRKANRRRNVSRARSRWIAALILLAAGWCAIGIVPHSAPPAREPLRAATFPPETPVELRNTERLRAVYPYSVIHGGVASIAELRRAIAGDPVVAAHYAGFDLTKAKTVRLDRARYAYVSYRLGDRLYWTKNKLLLAAGEMIVTDGVHAARSRCGNLIRETPASPTSAEEPPAQAWDEPDSPDIDQLVAANDPPRIVPFDVAPPLWDDSESPREEPDPSPYGSPVLDGGNAGFFMPPIVAPASDPPPGTATPAMPGGPSSMPSPTAVPEGSTLLHLLASMPAVWALRRQTKR